MKQELANHEYTSMYGFVVDSSTFSRNITPFFSDHEYSIITFVVLIPLSLQNFMIQYRRSTLVSVIQKEQKLNIFIYKHMIYSMNYNL